MPATLQVRHPGLKRILTSESQADVIAQRGMLDDGVTFIHKPFSAKDLVPAVRDLLDRNK